jgi:VCBS repeat protein
MTPPKSVVVVLAVAGTMLAAGPAHAAPAHRQGAAAARATDELHFGDLDGDGRADLAAVDSAGKLWVYPGLAYVYPPTHGPRPAAYFASRFQAGTGWSKFTALVRHGDWNNDGRQDILARDGQGRLFLYAGTGARPAVVRNGVQVGTGWNSFVDIVGAGDADRDGFDDLMGRRNGKLTIYYGTGNAAAPFRRATATSGQGWNGDLLTSLGDWNFDGRTDYLFRSTTDEVRLFWSTSTGFPSQRPLLTIEAGAGVRFMAGMGNLTSDSEVGGEPITQPTPDVAYTDAAGRLWVLTGDTDDEFNHRIGSGWRGYRIF